MLIGNRSSFAIEAYKYIKIKYKNTYINYIDKNHDSKEILYKLDKNIKEYLPDYLIVLSGEIRDNSRMKFLNNQIPNFLVNYCLRYNIKLIYLSSLSVFGIPSSNDITINSYRNPYNEYGISKNLADKSIKSLSNSLGVYCIMPSTIIGCSKHNFYQKILYALSVFPFKIIFSCLCPGGQYHFCSRKDIFEVILKILSSEKKNKSDNINQSFFKEIICSRTISIKELFFISNGYYPKFVLPPIKVSFINRFFSLLPRKIIIHLIFWFSKINYIN